MKINFFTTFYKDKSELRQEELCYCLKRNIMSGFSTINLLVEEKDYQYALAEVEYILGEFNSFANNPDVIVHKVKNRPSFNDFFEIMDEVSRINEISCLSNSDIFFQSFSIEQIKNFYKEKNPSCLALSRWDYDKSSDTETHFDRLDSQDTWIFYGKPNIRTEIEFTMGEAGCDNRLAYELSKKYEVLNPSKSIKTYHHHKSEIRNYVDESGNVRYRVPQPYKMITPY